MLGIKREKKEKPVKGKKKADIKSAAIETPVTSAPATPRPPEASVKDYARHRLSKVVLSYSVASTSGMLALILDRIDSDGIKPFVKKNAVVRFNPLHFLNENLEEPVTAGQGEFVPVPQFQNQEAADADDVEVNIL